MSEVAQFPLERRMSVEEHFRRAAIERKARLYYPPNGRKSEETEVLSKPALRKQPPPVKVIHDYPQVTFSREIFYAPSAYAGVFSGEEDLENPPLIDGNTVYPISVRDIARAACRVFSVSMLDLCSARRTAPIIRPRHIAMYLAREMTTRSLPEIARLFGRRDHTTVLHAWQKYTALVKTDDEAAAQVEAVRTEAIAGRRASA